MTENNIMLAGFSNEISTLDEDPFTQFFRTYPLFIANEKISPSFKEVGDYSRFPLFLEAIGKDSIKQENIIEVTFKENNIEFIKLKVQLAKYSISVSRDLEKETLILETDSSFARYSTSAYFLKFSGNIKLKSTLNISSPLVIFDNAKFYESSHGDKIYIHNGNQEHLIHNLYIRNSNLPYQLVEIKNIDSVWISGDVTLDNLEFIKTKSHLDRENCAFNIASNADIKVYNNINFRNINCINIEGNLTANNLKASYFDYKSELYIPKTGLLSIISELTVSHGKNLQIMQYGVLAANKMYISTAGIFYNSGIMILGNNAVHQTHEIKVHNFFNYKEGEIVDWGPTTSKLKIHTDSSFGNIGTIKMKDFSIIPRNMGSNTGTFYNSGEISSIGVFKIEGMSYGLNDAEGSIRAIELEVILYNNIKHIYYSASLINRGGEIKVIDANFDVNNLLSTNAITYLNSLTTTAKIMSVDGGESGIYKAQFISGVNLLLPNNHETQFHLQTTGNPHFDHIIVGGSNYREDKNSNSILPNSDVSNGVTQSIRDDGTNIKPQESSVIISGNFSSEELSIGQNVTVEIGNGHPSEGQHLSDNMKLTASESAKNYINISKVYVGQGSELRTSSTAEVSIGHIRTNDAKINSQGSTIIKENAHFYNTTIEGKVQTPALDNNNRLILSNANLTVDGDMFNKAIIEVVADSIITAQHIALTGDIIGTGSLQINSQTFFMGIITETLHRFVSNHQFIDTHIVNQPKINLEGVVILTAEEWAQFEGAEIKAKEIGIKSNGNIIILPKAIYHKAHECWDRGYNTKESWDYILSEFTAGDGIRIVSEKGNLLTAPNMKSNVPIILDTNGENIIQGISKERISESYSWWKKKKYKGIRKTRGELYNSIYESEPILSNLTDLHTRARKGGTFYGFEIQGSEKSVFTIGEEQSSVLAKFMPMMKVQIHNTKKLRSSSLIGLKASRTYISNYNHKEMPILNIIESSKGFYGYCYGDWIQIGTSIISYNEDGLISIEATDKLELMTAYGLEITQNIYEQYSVKFFSTLSLSEVSIGIGFDYSKSDDATLHKFPIQAVYRGNIHLIAPKLHTVGLNAEGGIFKVDAKEEWKDEEAKNEYSYSFKLTKLEIAKKIGIRSPIGSFINNVESAANGLKSGTIEGGISAGFATYSAYLSSVKMLSGAGGILSAGSWISISGTKVEQEGNITKITPSILKFRDFDINAKDIDLSSSQIYAYNAYIKAQTLNITSGVSTADSKQTMTSIDIDIPLSTGAPIGVNVAASESTSSSEQHLHFVLKVTNNLDIHITGKATLKGLTISAANIDAGFGDLILESVKDIAKTDGKGFGVGLSIGQQNQLSSLSGSYSKGVREVVSEITSIIGTENIKIVVARALHLNGAMFANAERSEDGLYTDLGNLQLTAAKLFVQHLYQYDEGITLAAGIKFGRNIATEKDKPGDINNQYKATFGMKDGSGYALTTLGNGIININSTQGEELNRDLNKANTGITYSVNIDPILMQFEGRDHAAEAKVEKRFEEGVDIKEIIKGEIDKTKSALFKDFIKNIFSPLSKEETTSTEVKKDKEGKKVIDSDNISPKEKELASNDNQDNTHDKEDMNGKNKNLQKDIFAPHLVQLYNEVKNQIESMPVSDKEKDQIRSGINDYLQKAINSPVEYQSQYIKDLFNLYNSPNQWLLDNTGSPTKAVEERIENNARESNEKWRKEDSSKQPKEVIAPPSLTDSKSDDNAREPNTAIVDQIDILSHTSDYQEYKKTFTAISELFNFASSFKYYLDKQENECLDCSNGRNKGVALGQVVAEQVFALAFAAAPGAACGPGAPVCAVFAVLGAKLGKEIYRQGVADGVYDSVNGIIE